VCVCVCVCYHLLDAVEALAVEAEGLFEQHLVLHRPLVRERGEVRQIGQRLLDVVFVPEEHAERLHTHTHTHTNRHTHTRDKAYILHVVHKTVTEFLS